MPAVASGYLYRHIRLDKNEPFYIGIGFSTDKYAQKGFYRAKTKKGRNKIWKDIIAKTDYEVEILFENLPLNQLLEKEIEFIKLYGRIDQKTGILANLTSGGQGTLGSKHNLGRKMSEKTKEKIKLVRGGVCCNYNKNLRKKVLQYDLEGNFIKEFISLNETKKEGYQESSIIKCCKNTRKTHAGFLWKYA